MPLSAVDYRPRDAEHGVLYRVIDEHLETFLETARRHADGASLPPPTDDEVGGVLARIATRVQCLLKRRGLDPSDADVLQADPVAEDSPTLAGSATP